MDRPKIVIFSALYMPHLGGVEKFSQSIAAELSKDSQVTVFCMNTEKQPDHIQEGSTNVYFLPCFPLQKGRFPVPKPSALSIIENHLRKDAPDFAIVQCRFYLLSFFACHILSRRKVSFIQIEHGAGDIVMPNPIVNRVWHWYEKILTDSEKRLPHDYYAVSEAGLRWLENFGIHGSGVISNSISPADFADALKTPGKWRRDHGIPDDAILITFSGRIMRDKGIVDLLEVFTQLKGDRIFLAVAGDGEMELITPWKQKKNILFLGQIDFSEIPCLLADTQIFCLPSRFIEGKPTSVLEAGYCGNAVVSTNRGGTVEIIPDERFGLLVSSGDKPALAAALQSLIDDPDRRQLMGKRLHERVQDLFTWETAAENVRGAMRKYGL